MMTCVWRTKRFVLLYSTRAPLSLASSVKCLAFCCCRSTLYSTQPQRVSYLCFCFCFCCCQSLALFSFDHLFILITHAIAKWTLQKWERRSDGVCVCSQNQLFIVRQAIGIVCNCMHGKVVERVQVRETNQRLFVDSRTCARANSFGPVSFCVPQHI